jgi:hypothetical protein
MTMAINYRPFNTPLQRRERMVERTKKQATRLIGAYMYKLGITEWNPAGWTTFSGDFVALPNSIRFMGRNSEKNRFIYELHGGLETLHTYITDNWSIDSDE